MMKPSPKYVYTILVQVVLISTVGAQNPTGIFSGQADVGPVLHPGTTKYNNSDQSYTLTGSGANIWFAKDEFHYAYNKISGDFILQARGRFQGAGVDPHRKFGWMVRSGLDTSVVMICVAIHGDGLAAVQFRKDHGGFIEEIRSPVVKPDVFQLERRGRTFVLSVAQFGQPYWTVEVPDIDLPDSLFAGLFICAHNKDVLETAVFDNVYMIKPAAPDFRPYQDYIGSRLEILDVQNGKRTMLYSTSEVIQAPNWTPDGQKLIYNKDGLIFSYDLSSGNHTEINTDSVKHNNNDHVLSFDGKMLGLSSSSGAPELGSLIYTVPVRGGTPKRITELGPSYLHGWSPDGEWLTYTAERNGEFDIYKIPSSGGEEIRLTNNPGLDDGSEYSPDGNYIYYNSVRSGNMEIWRMTPDGKVHTQITNDEYQNWFPHVSPDGKWIVFMSYMADIDPEDHPFYKHIYIRIMPADGGAPNVLAYVYGGQGTINVPSWSPDSRNISFVSNSD